MALSPAEPNLRVLIVDDDQVDRLWARRALAPLCVDGGLGEAADAASAELQLGTAEWDCALVDHQLGADTGLELTQRLRAAGLRVPVVMFTGHGDEQVAVAVMKAGATDYLSKNERTPEGVRRAIRNAVELARAAREREELVEQLAAERERLERAVRERDDVLAIVSHDLRNPLSTIALAADELPELDPAAVTHIAKVIRRNVKRAERLISDLLDISRIERGVLTLDLRPCDVERVGRSAVRHAELIAQRKGVSLELQVRGDGGDVQADPDRLSQVLDNLLSNAIRHTPEGGRVLLAIEHSAEGAQLEVRDTGPGVPSEERARLFDRFYQTGRKNEGGAGLGLAIAKGLVEAHQGSITVGDAPEGGARFTFHIPRTLATPTYAATP